MAKKDKKSKKSKGAEPWDDDGTLITPLFRVGYIGLPSDNGRYEVTAMFDAEDDDINDLEALALHELRKNFGKGDDWDDHDGSPFLSGDKRAKKGAKKGKPVDFYKRKIYMNLKTNFEFPISDHKGNDIEPTEKKKLYSGMWCRAVVSCYSYDKDGNSGVGFNIESLQKIKDDDKVGGGGGMSKKEAKDRFKSDPVVDKGGKKDKKSKKDKKDKKGKKK